MRVILLVLFLAATFFMGYPYKGKKIVVGVIGWVVLVEIPFRWDWQMSHHESYPFIAEEYSYGLQITHWLSVGAFFFLYFKERLFPPIIELLSGALVLAYSILYLVIGIQLGGSKAHFIIMTPGVLIMWYTLVKNQLNIVKPILESRGGAKNWIENILYKSVVNQFPYYLVIVTPLVVLISWIFMLFGQEPDAMIRAFTETYGYNFSKLKEPPFPLKPEQPFDENGHYLCTIAAQGSTNVVKPLRFGIRNNKRIICNRQLLISNAFEEIIQERFPKAHRLIRKNYDKIGNFVSRNYNLFQYKWVSNLVFIIMKPLEWIFLFTLYLFETHPENRIAKQYLNIEFKNKP